MGRARPAMPLLLVLILAPLARAQTSVEGRLVNGTSGGPGRADLVTIVSVAGGMEEIASLEDVKGSFRFDDLEGGGPFIVQAEYQDVVYNGRVPPGTQGTASVEITVYDATTDVSGLVVSLPHVIMMARPDRLRLSRVYEVRNEQLPLRSVVGDPGVIRFERPRDGKLERCSFVSGGSTMPLKCDLVETEGGFLTVEQPIRPGASQLEVVFDVPYDGSYDHEETLYHPLQQLNVVVVPASLEIRAPRLQDQGVTEAQGLRFRAFTAAGLEAGEVLAVSLKGEGQMTGMGSASGRGQEGVGPDTRFEVFPPGPMRGSGAFLFMGGAAAVLALGLILMWAGPPERVRDGKRGPRPPQRG